MTTEQLSIDQLATIHGGIDLRAAHREGVAQVDGAARVGSQAGIVAGAVGGAAGAGYVFPPLMAWGAVTGGALGYPVGSAVGGAAGYLYGAGKNIYHQLRGR
jgi:hypothetical protein